MTDQLYLTEKQAAARYNVSQDWLRHSRYNGTGPKYFKIGNNIRYDLKLTDQWFKDKSELK